MKRIVHLFYAVIIILFSTDTFTGCTDFPDDYAFDASIEFVANDDAILSEDGKSYTSTLRVKFDIKENSFGEITNAIVWIDEVMYDVAGQLDPASGGTVEISHTSECNNSANVEAKLQVYGHTIDESGTIYPEDFDDSVTLSTGKAENVTPCSANLYVNADFPWLVNSDDIYILVSDKPINITSDSTTDLQGIKALYCKYQNSSYWCKADGLAQNQTYYYKMVRMSKYTGGSSENLTYKVRFASDTKSFKTEEATAKLAAFVSDAKLTSIGLYVTIDKGNLAGLWSNSSTSANYGYVEWYVGDSSETLESMGTTAVGSSTSLSRYIYKLNASTKYYYKCDLYIGDGLMASSGIQEFSTSQSTAILNVSTNNLYANSVDFDVTLTKGNTTGVITSYSGDYYAGVKLYYGTSKENMNLQQTLGAYNSSNFTFSLSSLSGKTKYYYKVCYCAGNSILATSDILEFTTFSFSDISHIGSLSVSTTTRYSSGSELYTINAREGSVIGFRYTINQGSHNLNATLTGPNDVTLVDASSSSSDWRTGSVYYTFTKAGTYTLTLSYSCRMYASLSVPDIILIY